MKKVALTILFVIIFGFIGFSTVQALELDLSFAEPGVVDSNIASYIVRFYWFGVGIAGLLAVGMIVAGAIYYSVSAANPDKQRDARGMITGALWGVALLLGSYLILNTINPQIVTLKTPGGDLPVCSNENERPGIDCLPRPLTSITRVCTGDPIVLPNGSSTPEIIGTNCLPACGVNERACGIGQATSTGCSACTYAILECPETTFAYGENIGIPFFGDDAISCKAGAGIRIAARERGIVDIPNCEGFRLFGAGGLGSCEDSINFSRTAPRIEIGGGVWAAPYYPSNVGPSGASCIVYAYRVSTSSDVETTKLSGLKQC
ncbi:MAG: hypothetical protein KJI72_02175 [Patescibacteria group bacterium]|nr:hypothetical protein [Patescibacteria group bacterium]